MISLTLCLILSVSGIALAVSGIKKRHHMVTIVFRFINGVVGIVIAVFEIVQMLVLE